MESIYRFHYDSKHGELCGIFTATAQQIKDVIAKGSDFGEALGKHSHLYFAPGELEEYIELVTSDQNAVIIFNNFYMGTGVDLTIDLYDDEDE